MPDENSNILDFLSLKAALENVEEPITVSEKKWNSCRHKRSTICFEDRRVECRDCGVELDPYQVIHKIAREYSGWKVYQLKEHLAELEKLVKKIEAKRRTDLMTEEELAMDTLEWRAAHRCDPERMWRKGDMIHCYCGSSFNRHAFPKRALEVYEAHERLAQKAKFTLKKWE